MAASTAFSEATHDHAPDRLIGVDVKTWSAKYRGGETVDLVLLPGAAMTWRMLAEGITGVQMLAFEKKEILFVVLMEDSAQEVGWGQIRRRGDLARKGGYGVAARRSSSPSSFVTLPINPAVRERSRVKAVGFRDPYVRHDAGMITTWEYYGYRGPQLNRRACQAAWEQLLADAMDQIREGRGGTPLGTQNMHWPVRSREGEWVDLVVVPGEAMTWRMLKEGAVGGFVVCLRVGLGFQFALTAEGVEGPVGVGQITARERRGTVA
ncbi:MAG: hypothetical protein Q9207_003121 [Kuettlingeria erythrocarpa]